MKKLFLIAAVLFSANTWAADNDDNNVIPSTSEFGDEETLTTGIINDLIQKNVAKKPAKSGKADYGFNLTDYASTPKVGAYVIGYYKYSSQDGAHDGPGFNARLIRAYVDGTILNDFKYRLQIELNGSPHMKDFYLEWAKYKEFSVKMGQFKRAFGFENPMNPWDVGVGDYSQLSKKLVGYGDRCGEASTGGRDQGFQVQGDLFPITSDKHRLLHYQLGLYNGNGINKADNNARKDIIGTIQLQPIKGLFVGFFGWKGNWNNGTVTVDRTRYAIGAKYEKNNWSARSEYVHSTGHKASEYNTVTKQWSGTGEADAFYATVGIPFTPWFKLFLKYDQYRDQATADTKHTIYMVAPNFRLHKNLNFQIQYNYHNDKNAADSKYSDIWLMTYVRF
jgi:hypothetical protein